MGLVWDIPDDCCNSELAAEAEQQSNDVENENWTSEMTLGSLASWRTHPGDQTCHLIS